MAYDWRPTTGTATTTASRAAVRPRRPPQPDPTPPSPPEDIRVGTAIEEFIEAAQVGRVGTRSGRPYRPSALRDLRGSLRRHVARDLGHMRLRAVRRQDVQALVDRLAADQLSVSRIRSVVSAIRALYGWAIEQGYVEFSPADRLVVPQTEPQGRGGDDDYGWDGDEDEDDSPPGDETGYGEEEVSWDRPPRGQPAARREPRRREQPRPDRYAPDFQALALLPERILSLVLRIAVVLFLLFALFTIAESV
jgi:hypothetical protein